MSGPAPRTVGPGVHDPAMLEPDNPVSNGLNAVIDCGMSKLGYSTVRRGSQGTGSATGGSAGDNSFYRDNADMMPGWGNSTGGLLSFLDPAGLPSGAFAQDRATNYVGHTDPTGIWSDVRERLVTNESRDIAAAKSAGKSNISFGEVYDAHVQAYDGAQAQARADGRSATANNPFIDPMSFAIASYGVPLLEKAGINTGPMTAASIDLFNDPTDSVGDGWAKRMALGMGEMAVNPMLGMGTIIDNTRTALDHGMGVGDMVSGTGHAIAGAGKFVGDVASDAWSAVFGP